MSDKRWFKVINNPELFSVIYDDAVLDYWVDRVRKGTAIETTSTGQPLEPVPGGIEHTRSCPALGLSEPRGPGTSEDCTCCLRWKIALQTEQTMHVAWRKRAEEAEAENADIKNELSHMRESEAIQDRAVLLENVKALESRLIAGEPVPGSKSTQADMAIAEKLRPELERLLQSECEKFPAAKKTTPDPEKMARINELVKKIESEESKKEAGGEGGELPLTVGCTVECTRKRRLPWQRSIYSAGNLRTISLSQGNTWFMVD